MSEEQRRLLQQALWNIANTLRGKMNADEFRDYILGFIFYKYLSEKIALFGEDILKADNLKFKELDETTAEGAQIIDAVRDASVKQLGYFLKPTELFATIAQKGNSKIEGKDGTATQNYILTDLEKILRNIEQSTLGTESQDDFINLFEDLDLTSSKLGNTEKAKNELVSKILLHLNQIDFALHDANADVLGDAYEYLIGEFASGAGKKAGEFYTPQPVSSLLAKIVTSDRKLLKNAYDPTCGSGSLLLRVNREARERGGKIGKIHGQELNRTTYNLARMNMILHDVHYRDFDIRQEDTLEHPQHMGQKFEAIVANPPFSANWSANPIHMSDDRFSQYGKLAPSSKADMAFIQHMLYHLFDDGIMAVVMPHGVLFRGAAEGHIRSHIIRELNALDAVIGLPPNIFYGTSIPTCVLVFKKCRKHPNDVLFIDASREFEKVKTQNKLLPEHIDKIVQTYKNRTVIDKYSAVATIEQIKANDYNLNIPRYVDTFEAEAQIGIEAVAQQIREIEQSMGAIDAKIADYCQQLGITSPFTPLTTV